MPRSLWLTLVVFALPLSRTHAQTEGVDDVRRDLVRQRNAVLRYLAAMPDSALQYRPVPVVRSFAEQIEHIGLAASLLSAGIASEMESGTMATGACGCNGSRASLGAFIATAFDNTLRRLDAMSATALASDMESFGQKQSRLAWFRWIQEHTAWTLGQVVPYLRIHGVQPPPYMPF